jgi:DNA-binding PadR family transcriptional regulator
MIVLNLRILAALGTTDLSAEQIYQQMLDDTAGLLIPARRTFYRSLDMMMKDELIIRQELKERKIRYQLTSKGRRILQYELGTIKEFIKHVSSRV